MRLLHLKKESTVRSAAINVIIKPIGIILGLVYTPLLLSYLGDEKYGVWVTMLSIISWINYCDIGIGNGLRNVLTKYLTNNQLTQVKKVVSTSYVCLTAITGVLLIPLVILTFVVNWGTVFGTNLSVEIPLLISFVFICINFILALCNTLLYSLQRSELVSIQSVTIQVLNIIGIFLLRLFTDGSLVYVAILFGSTTLLLRLLTSIRLFNKYQYLAPEIKEFDLHYTKEVCSIGVKFFIAQFAALVLFTTDNLLVSNLYGAKEVTPFSIADKIFNTGFMVFSAITVPFWSKTTQEIERRDFSIVKKYFRNLNYLAVVFTIGCIGVAVIFNPAVKLWLGKDLTFSPELITVMCVYYAVYAFCGVSSPFINGMGGVNGVMVLGIIQGVANIPLSIFFAKYLNMGIVGIRLGTLVVVLGGAIFQYIYFYYLINKIEKSTI